MVRIRLRRMGLRNRPSYRVVAIDSRRARDSRYLELLGHYDPRRKLLRLKLERIRHWLANGAQPSATVAKLVRRAAREHTDEAAPSAIPTTSPTVAAAPAAAEMAQGGRPELEKTAQETATTTGTPTEEGV